MHTHGPPAGLNGAHGDAYSCSCRQSLYLRPARMAEGLLCAGWRKHWRPPAGGARGGGRGGEGAKAASLQSPAPPYATLCLASHAAAHGRGGRHRRQVLAQTADSSQVNAACHRHVPLWEVQHGLTQGCAQPTCMAAGRRLQRGMLSTPAGKGPSGPHTSNSSGTVLPPPP